MSWRKWIIRRGHPCDGDYLCMNGLIYGPCGDPYCYGGCMDVGECEAKEGCCDNDEETRGT